MSGINEGFVGFANPAFSSPELLAGKDIDPRADLYSLGTLAWLMLTGAIPVADGDAQQTAADVREGRLLPWQRVSGVPARLAALIQQCLRHDPDERPSSAREVRERLAVVRSGPLPGLARVAVFAAGLALVIALALGSDAPSLPVFLQPLPGSPLTMSVSLPANAPALDLRSDRLHTLTFHYGGFAPERLRAEITRHGQVLARVQLHPEVDRDAGSLVLSTAQGEWAKVVDGLLASCREEPVDLAFVVPGEAQLGSMRLRVDDAAPQLRVRLDADDVGIRADSKLLLQVDDEVGVSDVGVLVVTDRGARHELPVPPPFGPYAIGASLAEVVDSPLELGPGELVVVARDRAGNERRSDPIRFASADVKAPRVVEVSGPSGEPFAVRMGGRLRLRVRLSTGERGCRLRFEVDGAAAPPTVPLGAVDGPDPSVQLIEIPAEKLAADTNLAVRLVVVDEAGNESTNVFNLAVRDRDMTLELVPRRGDIRWHQGELVIGAGGATAQAVVGGNFVVVGARLDQTLALPRSDAVRLIETGSQSPLVEFGEMPPGSYGLTMEVAERAPVRSVTFDRPVALQVLPRVIEVRLPKSNARFLSPLLRAGLLSERGDAVGEGQGWLFDPEWRPFVRGQLFVGRDAPVSLPIAAEPGRLLPDVVLATGYNVLAIELVDVLGRKVRVVRDDGTALATDDRNRAVIAKFWWIPPRQSKSAKSCWSNTGSPRAFACACRCRSLRRIGPSCCWGLRTAKSARNS